MSEIGAADKTTVPINTPRMLIFFIVISRLELHNTFSRLGFNQVKNRASCRGMKGPVWAEVPRTSSKIKEPGQETSLELRRGMLKCSLARFGPGRSLAARQLKS